MLFHQHARRFDAERERRQCHGVTAGRECLTNGVGSDKRILLIGGRVRQHVRMQNQDAHECQAAAKRSFSSGCRFRMCPYHVRSWSVICRPSGSVNKLSTKVAGV